MRQMSPWLPKATVAIEDRRFYQHGGVDYVGIARAAWADVDRRQGAAGRLDDHAAARAQPLHRPGAHVQPQDQGGVPRDQAREQVVEAEDPQRVPEHRLLRQPRLRRRGGGADVLLRAREPADARCRPRCSPGCRRRRRSTTRSTTRRPRSAAATRCCARCSSNSDITARAVRRGGRGRTSLDLKPGSIYTSIKRAVLLLVRDRPARAAVRREHRARGRAQGLHDDRPAAAAAREQGDARRCCRTAPIPRPRSSRSSRAPARSAR